MIWVGERLAFSDDLNILGNAYPNSLDVFQMKKTFGQIITSRFTIIETKERITHIFVIFKVQKRFYTFFNREFLPGF